MSISTVQPDLVLCDSRNLLDRASGMEKGNLYNEYKSVLDQYNQLSPSDQTGTKAKSTRIALNSIADIYKGIVSPAHEGLVQGAGDITVHTQTLSTASPLSYDTLQADLVLHHSRSLLDCASGMGKGDLVNEYSFVLDQYNQLSPSGQTGATAKNIRIALNSIADIYKGIVSPASVEHTQKVGSLTACAQTLSAASPYMNDTLVDQHSKYIFKKYDYLSLKGTRQGEVIEKTTQAAKDASKPTWKIPWKGIAVAGTVIALGVAIWYATSSSREAGLQDFINEEPKAPVEPPTNSEQTSSTHIDKFYFINLDRDKKRLSHMKQTCAVADIACERFPAVIGKELNIDELIQKGIYQPHPKYKSHWLKPSELGNALTHHGIWREVAAKGTNVTVVMEDDITFPRDYRDKVEGLLESVPKDWDILYLGCNANQEDDFFAPCRPENLELTPDRKFSVLNEKCTAGNWAYAINLKGAQELSSKFFPLQRPTDYMIKEKFIENGRLRKQYPDQRGIKAYCANPEIAKIGVGLGTSIGAARGQCKDVYCKD